MEADPLNTHGPRAAYPQSSLGEIIDSERAMIRDGEVRYGRHYKHARNATLYLTLCVSSFDKDRSDIFGRLVSLMKKHHMLAFLSALRLHHVQAVLNLRQVLEAGAAVAYSIANPNVGDFVDIDEFGIMDPSKDGLWRKRYKWLDENYPSQSAWIKEQKDLINKQTAHANIVSGDMTFHVVEEGKGVRTPFFDIEDEALVKIDLWQISSVAITLLHLFYDVTSDVARTSGRSVVGFRTDFQMVSGLAHESVSLLDEQRRSDRFKAAMLTIEQRANASGKPESKG